MMQEILTIRTAKLTCVKKVNAKETQQLIGLSITAFKAQ